MIGRYMLDRLMRRRRGYAICTTPRSGSNLLCQYLTSTGIMGKPLEYFNGPARRALNDPRYPDDPVLQLRQILTTGMTPNGVYGVKVFAYQNAAVAASLDWTRALPNLSFIYLTRRDRLGQAISWAKALQTSQYRSTLPKQGVAIYEARLIRERLDALRWEDTEWDRFFQSRCITPLHIAYEDFIIAPQQTVDRVAALVGVRRTPRIAFDQVDLRIQRDVETEEWRVRFLDEPDSEQIQLPSTGHRSLAPPQP